MKMHPSRQVAHANLPVAGLRSPEADRESEADAAAIPTSLRAGREQVRDLPLRQAAALVLDVEEDTVRSHAGRQRDGAAFLRELECVVQRIGDGCDQDGTTPSTVSTSLTGCTVNWRPLACACIAPLIASSSRNPATRKGVAFLTPASRRTSARDWSTRPRPVPGSRRSSGPCCRRSRPDLSGGCRTRA